MNVHGSGFSLVADAPSCSDGGPIQSLTGYWFNGAERQTLSMEPFRQEDSKPDGDAVRKTTTQLMFVPTGSTVADRENNARKLNASFNQSENWKPYCRIVERAGKGQWDPAVLTRIAKALTIRTTGLAKPDAKGIPAAYTYFGQFIAHEISDIADVNRGGPSLTPHTAAFDLGSIFNVTEPKKTYKHKAIWCGGVGIGRIKKCRISEKLPEKRMYDDLPRDNKGKALIGDVRNDHNLSVAQTHVALSKFYQSYVHEFPDILESEIRNMVRVMIQEVALFDYLKRLCDPETYCCIMENGRKAIHPKGLGSDKMFMIPIEFSAACFRIGHSMVRDSYVPWGPHGATAFLSNLTKNTEPGGGISINGYALKHSWVVDWNTQLGDEKCPEKALNSASRINQMLNPDLALLEKKWFSKGAHVFSNTDGQISLATVTLNRDLEYQLPNAQALSEHEGFTSALSATDLLADGTFASDDPGGLKPIMLNADMHCKTPLWLYCLLEAQSCHGGQRLGPLASRVIVETIHAAIEASGSGLIECNKVTPGEKRCTLYDVMKRAKLWTA